MRSRAVTFTGIRFENPFLLASGPSTESETNILRAFDAGWGGVVVKTISLRPAAGVAGPRAAFLRTSLDGYGVSVRERPGSALCGSWHWGLTSEKTLDWWMTHIRRIKNAYPTRIVIASIIAGSASDAELRDWQLLAQGCEDAGADGLECNLSGGAVAAHSNERVRCAVIEAVKGAATIPVWAKVAPAGRDVLVEADACFQSGADAIVSSNTLPSLPLIDPDTLEFEVNVDGLVSPGGLGGPAIFPLALDAMARLSNAFPDRAFSGVGGVSDFSQALSYFLLGAGTVQVGTAAMLDQSVGPTVIRRLNVGLDTFLSRNADKGWSCVNDFRGIRRARVVATAQIRRGEVDRVPSSRSETESYAAPEPGLRAQVGE
jgi:dihydropyrimidine dehydrogenase (NAD+) subunit PreA